MDPADDFPRDDFEEEEEEEHSHAAEAPEESVMSSDSSAVKEPRVIRISPFLESIADAILTQNKKGGSSLVAISKHIQKKYGNMPDPFEESLRMHLKRFLKEGKIGAQEIIQVVEESNHCPRILLQSCK